jgi:toxin-antitoxin system PIN domain toxin
MRALLDVNVLIALLDAGHVHHGLAMSWLKSQTRYGWASCPLTQNGCIRIMSQPKYPANLAAAQVAGRLAEAANRPSHEFWPADVDMLIDGVFDWTKVLGHRQVTDVYLLALAVQHGGRFVTFDQRIVLDAVKGARAKNLVVLA